MPKSNNQEELKQEKPEYDVILPVLKEPRFSIDKITLLVYSPGFSAYEACKEFDDRQGYKTEKVIKQFVSLFDKVCEQKSIQGKRIQYSLETKLYQYHYKIEDIDIQFCTKLPNSKRVDDEEYIEVFGDEEDKKNGYMYEYYSNNYNFRIEYNPNKADISKVNFILAEIIQAFYKETYSSVFIRVSRMDLAFDYPESINPGLIDFRFSRKYHSDGSKKNGLETIYHGTRKSKFELVVYDKKYQYEKEERTFYSGVHLWRIELRCCNNWFIYELPGLGMRVLPRIEIFDRGLRTGDFKMDWALMLAVHWGIRSVLSYAPHATQERYLKKYRDLSGPSIVHPGDLYLENFRSIWDAERDKILKAFGFKPEQFCSRAVSDSKL
jgi:hypothetical protein